jgi:hypothetical protein
MAPKSSEDGITGAIWDIRFGWVTELQSLCTSEYALPLSVEFDTHPHHYPNVCHASTNSLSISSVPPVHPNLRNFFFPSRS